MLGVIVFLGINPFYEHKIKCDIGFLWFDAFMLEHVIFSVESNLVVWILTNLSKSVQKSIFSFSSHAKPLPAVRPVSSHSSPFNQSAQFLPSPFPLSLSLSLGVHDKDPLVLPYISFATALHCSFALKSSNQYHQAPSHRSTLAHCYCR